MEKQKYNNLTIGDYCHAHRWSDKDPCDPYAIGYLAEIRIIEDGTFYRLAGNGCPNRFFPHCEKITMEQGIELLNRKDVVV